MFLFVNSLLSRWLSPLIVEGFVRLAADGLSAKIGEIRQSDQTYPHQHSPDQAISYQFFGRDGEAQENDKGNQHPAKKAEKKSKGAWPRSCLVVFRHSIFVGIAVYPTSGESYPCGRAILQFPGLNAAGKGCYQASCFGAKATLPLFLDPIRHDAVPRS